MNTPLKILKEYVEQFNCQNKEVLKGSINTIFNKEDANSYDFTIIAPDLNNYYYNLFLISNGEFYPEPCIMQVKSVA